MRLVKKASGTPVNARLESEPTLGFPGWVLKPAMPHDIAARSSIFPQSAGAGTQKVVRTSPNSAESVTTARPVDSWRQSKIPVLRTKAYMPGAHLESDTGIDERSQVSPVTERQL